RGLDARRVEVGKLVLRDLADLLLGDLADLGLVRLARAALDLRGLLDQDRRRRRLRDEREAAVGVRGDEDRNDQVAHLLSARVELLAELHDVEAVLSECRTDGRRRVRLAGGTLQLDESTDFFHDGAPPPAAERPERGGVMLSLPGRSQAPPT